MQAVAAPLTGPIPKPIAPAVFKARIGRRRVYLSQADAHAYERGWATFPAPYLGPLNCPESNGWFDHECAYLDARDAMEERGRCEDRR